MSNLSLRFYRLAAKMMGIALCRHEIVKSVYADHGVGRGEVAFGRSDIDLAAIVREPHPETGDSAELYALYRAVCTLRRLNPALSHIMVYDARSLDRWMRTDSYFGSIERRSMLLVAGKPIPTPDVPVRREDAVRWIPFYNDRFLPTAVQHRSRRNLRKITTETWNSWAVARGIASKPFVSRGETRQQALLHSSGEELSNAGTGPRSATAFIMKLAGMMHDELFPPLDKLQEPIVCRMPMPPRSRQRVLVVLPRPGVALPAPAFEPQSLLATPEMLHLSIHYFNPFLDWTLPPELRSLGFLRPTPREFVRACLFYGENSLLRRPGFVRSDAWLPYTVFAFNEYSLPYLRSGQTPPPMPEEALRSLLQHNPTCDEYYRREYASIYKRWMEQLNDLENLEAPGIYPSFNTPPLKRSLPTASSVPIPPPALDRNARSLQVTAESDEELK